MNLLNDIRILLKNPKLYDVRCTGKFRQSDGIDYSLHVLQRFVRRPAASFTTPGGSTCYYYCSA